MEFEEKTISRKEIYRGPIFKLVQDQVELPEGKGTAQRDLIFHNGGVCVLAVTAEDLSLIHIWYVSALALKADLYQLEGLTDVAREKLLEALNYSDDALLVFGLAELDSELGNYQEAIQGYAQLDNRSIYEQTGVSTYQRIGYAYAQLGKFEAATEFLEKALELEYDDQTAFELASLYFDQEEYQKSVLYFKQIDTCLLYTSRCV